MAINIFNSPASKAKGNVNTASNSSRAAQAKQALSAPAETSSSGNTAVKTSGTLSKVGNFVGKAAGIASKFLPGIGGTIAKGISSLFNDPEWWQSVPGDAITLNEQLRLTKIPMRGDFFGTAAQLRAAIAEITAATPQAKAPSMATECDTYIILKPTINQVTQYLMPEIRKVVNAIPLQAAEDYSEVLSIQATLYAIWQQLKKFDYMLKHGTTYLPNMNDPAFPAFQVVNASWLQSTINRLEEYLRANVRLPHTLCEYLAWRFGRVYRSNDSSKAGLIVYNVVPMNFSTKVYNDLIDALMSRISAKQSTQAANTDIYNTYYDHDQMVVIRDDTQFSYDAKEFMLRTNLNLVNDGSNVNESTNIITIDSHLDNPTTFMASTISTEGSHTPLVPAGVLLVHQYMFESKLEMNWFGSTKSQLKSLAGAGTGTLVASQWMVGTVIRSVFNFNGGNQVNLDFTALGQAMLMAIECKSLDLYNKGIYVRVSTPSTSSTADTLYVDVTAISIDAGPVQDAVIDVEQTYAFANLVDITRKLSTSYAKAEKMLARDTADLVDKLDIATVKA